MSDAPSGGRPSRTLLIILGVVAAFAVLFVFVISPLLSGGDDGGDVELGGEAAGPSEAASPASPDSEPKPDSEDDTGKPPAETFEVFSARDPFQQLVSDDGGGDAAATTSGASGSDATTSGASGSDATTSGDSGSDATTSGDSGSDATTSGDSGASGTAGSATGSTGSADAPEDANVGGTTVTLVDVYENGDGQPAATVTVNGTGYTVDEGDNFAQRFRLLDVAKRCATLLFGDSRFTLCEGEAIRK